MIRVILLGYAWAPNNRKQKKENIPDPTKHPNYYQYSNEYRQKVVENQKVRSVSMYYDLVHHREPQINKDGVIVGRLVLLVEAGGVEKFNHARRQYTPIMQAAADYTKKELGLTYEPRVVDMERIDKPKEVYEHLACPKSPCLSVEYDSTWYTKESDLATEMRDPHDTIDFMFHAMGHNHWEEEKAQARRKKYREEGISGYKPGVNQNEKKDEL